MEEEKKQETNMLDKTKEEVESGSVPKPDTENTDVSSGDSSKININTASKEESQNCSNCSKGVSAVRKNVTLQPCFSSSAPNFSAKYW